MLSFLPIYFFTCFLPDLSIYSRYSFRNRSVSGPVTGGRGRRANLALDLLLILCCSYFVPDAYLLLLCLFWFFSTKPRDWPGRRSRKWTILCRVGRKTLTRSINQSAMYWLAYDVVFQSSAFVSRRHVVLANRMM